MISTLTKLGKQLSENRRDWDDLIDYPNVTKARDANLKCYVGELVFDLDLKIVYTITRKEKLYEENDCTEYKNIKIQGGNNKAFYCCVPFGKSEQIRKTFFGTNGAKGKPSVQGQLQELISKDFPQFSNTLLFNLLPQIFNLKNKFETQFTVIKGDTERVIDEKLLFNANILGNTDKIVLLFASVIAARNGIKKATPVANITGYDDLIKAKFFDKNSTEKTADNLQKICYASGELLDNVYEAEFTDRFSLNKMFVKGTKNYVTGFNKDNIGLNYQVNSDNQLCLSRASKYILETHKIKIAGIDHCIIPQFLSNSIVDVKNMLAEVHKTTDLIFQSAEYTATIPLNEKDEADPFWITYLAFETDGNFLKTIHQIGNFSNHHLNKILEVLNKVDAFFRTDLSYAVDWQSATNEYGNSWKFNLATVNSIIPIRKDNGKKNDLLALFKMIFESREIDLKKIYFHFCELILCHRYKRYISFKNIKKYDDQYFILAIRDAVFRYLALITFLKKMKFFKDLEQSEINLVAAEQAPVEYEQRTNFFFQQMGYNSSQKAMFFLGQLLKIITFTPYGKNNNLINKLNFNGMAKSDILRLRNSLLDKDRQADNLDNSIAACANFDNHFNYTEWNMNKEESLFYLLSGYTFEMIKN